MHIFRLFPSLVFIAFFTISSFAASWEHTNIPCRDKVSCLSTSGSQVLGGVDYGFTYSLDSGKTWFEGQTATYNANTTFRYGGTVEQLLPFGTDTVLALLDDHLMASYNSGCTWDEIPNAAFFVALTIKDTLLFAGSTARSGTWVSSDHGATWKQPSNAGITELRIISMATFGQALYAGTRENGIFTSNDNGMNWDTINSGLAHDTAGVYVQPSILHANNEQLFAVTDSGLFRKTDGTSAWTRIDTTIVFKHINALMHVGSTLFAGTDSGLYCTNDNGNRWEEVDAGIPLDTLANKPRVFSLTSSNYALYAGTHRGIYLSTDTGSTWMAANTHATITSFTGRGNTLFAGTAQGIYETNDNGDNWSHITNSPLAIECLNNTDSLLLAGGGTGALTSGRVYTSADRGTVWDGTSKLHFQYSVTSFAVHDSCILAGVRGGHGVYKKALSVNSGWNIANEGLQPPLPSESDLSPNWLICHNNTFFLANRTHLYRSDTYGSTWDVSDSGVVGTALVIVSKDSTCFAATDSGIFYSNDNGHQWKLSLTLSGITHMIREKENLFVVNDKGILFSRDNGVTWHTLSGMLPSPTVRAFYIHDDYIYVAFVRGSVYRIPLTDALSVSRPVVAKRIKQGATIAFAISNNRLMLSCSQTSSVGISLFTLAGKKTSAITNRMFSAGTHIVPFNQRNLSAGTYLLEVQSASETHRIPVVVVR